MIKLRRLLLLALLPLAAVLAACETQPDNVIQTDIPFRADGYLDFIRADSSTWRIAIEIAETDSAQARGLMDRRSLPVRGGMLFVEEASEMKQFWMKSTPLPLDILFIADDMSIINIVKRTVPYSEEFINSTAPAQFVLEVRAGATDQWNIQPGDRVRWVRTES